jgi:hypothetical protein
MRKYSAVVGVVFANFIVTAPDVAHAQDFTPKWSALVQLKVEASSEATEPFNSMGISYYLNKEFRKLRDITLVQENPDYLVRIHVVTNRVTDGRILGFTAHTIVTESIDNKRIRSALKSVGNPEDRKSLSMAISVGQVIHFGSMYSAPPDGIEKMCARIVADIDADLFQESRTEFQRIVEKSVTK